MSSNSENPVKDDDKYIFTYKGIDYDASEYIGKHPGGPDFLKNMKN